MSLLLTNARADHIPLKDRSVHMIASSPPYYGLRDYGLPPSHWPAVEFVPMAGLPAVTVPEWNGCLGMEPDPLMFVAHIVHIMREGRRVLRDDGTAWLNFGDSFVGYKGDNYGMKPESSNLQAKTAVPKGHEVGTPDGNLKPKDMMGIPWRIAFALQADGWYLRSDIIWSKSNPMPESVNGWRWARHQVKVKNGRVARHGIERGPGHVNESNVSSRNDGASWADCPGCDKCAANGGYILRKGSWRPTKSHEYIFMLAKTDKYYCDKDAVTEPLAESSEGRAGRFQAAIEKYGSPERPDSKHRKNGIDQSMAFSGLASGRSKGYDIENGRNLRDVWEVNTSPYSGAHFATWPPGLVEKMIKAGTSERGVCSSCGAPWVRVVGKGEFIPTRWAPGIDKAVAAQDVAMHPNGNNNERVTSSMVRGGINHTLTLDWKPACTCAEHDPVPAVVLDIFVGSGTTLLVARQFKRHGVGVDLSFPYLQNEARTRLSLAAVDALQNGTGIAGSGKKAKGKKVSNQMTLLEEE